MFYVAGEWCGALVLTPDNSETIQSLPNHAQFTFTAIGRNSKRKEHGKFKTN